MSIFTPPISADPPSVPGAVLPIRAIGALWRRILAFVVDMAVLFVTTTLVVVPFFETFSRLGPWGPLVGFCLTLPYFAILNSSIGNGQTLGKRLLHIQVIDTHGATIPLWKSVIRYTALAVPFFLNEVLLPTTRTPRVVSIFVSVVVLGVGGSTLYLVLFNRRTRQGIHDLAVGSYVADGNKDGVLKTDRIWRAHLWILGASLAVVFLGTGALGSKVARWEPFPQLLEDVRLVESMEGVQEAGAQDRSQNNFGGGEKKAILLISVYWAGQSSQNPAFTGNLTGDFKEGWASKEAFADQVAKLIIEHDPTVNDHDSLKVVVIRGYNLGVARGQVSYFYEHTPSEWNTRLFGKPSTKGASPNQP